jgi:hypothetical protein
MNKCKIEWVSEKRVKISGIIDEFSSFRDLFSHQLEEIWIDFSGVTRINSSGIREWVQAVLSSNVRLHMENCSAVMVDQFSMIPEFIGKNGVVESFFVHYLCDACGHEEKNLCVVGKDIKAEDSYKEALDDPCPVCGGVLELDHNPDIYFAFLKFMKNTPQAS